jgi:glycosyltransferase involved in cell wall biosynthesis
MRRLRIAYLPASLRPGGAERQMLALAERLPRDRFAVEFLALSGPGEDDERAAAIGIPVRIVGAPRSPAETLPANVARVATRLTRYAKTVRRQRYDIVDAWLYPSDVFAALMAPLTGRPIVISGRRNVDPQDRFGPFERVIGLLSRKFTDAVVANSAAAASHAVAAHAVDPAKLRIIRNGVERMASPPPAERAELRAALGIATDDVLVGCVANYRPVKRHELLIDAFGALVAEGHPVRLVLVGDGPERARMERQIAALGLKDRVRLHGSVPDPRSLYGTFDVVVQTSAREGLPNALLEGGAAGRAIVATDAGGTNEIVIDGRTGLLVPVEDVGALTRALRSVVSDSTLRDRLGGAARDHVETVFGMDRFVNEFATLYESLAAARGIRAGSAGAIRG